MFLSDFLMHDLLALITRLLPNGKHSLMKQTRDIETVSRDAKSSLKKRIQAYVYCQRKELILSSEIVIKYYQKWT